ncbi:MAG TPA: hypothetical protein VGQ63_13735 [Pseudolabrys sp.]|jgi:hypothetical protein|nr:hypothetical protein [Pseudolabrys sp.]
MTETNRNGNGLDEQAKAVEAGLATHLRVKGELDEAHREIVELRMQLSQAAVESEALRSFNNLLESRLQGCVAERDEAVTRFAKLEQIHSSVLAIMREVEIPNVPLILKADGAPP